MPDHNCLESLHDEFCAPCVQETEADLDATAMLLAQWRARADGLKLDKVRLQAALDAAVRERAAVRVAYLEDTARLVAERNAARRDVALANEDAAARLDALFDNNVRLHRGIADAHSEARQWRERADALERVLGLVQWGSHTRVDGMFAKACPWCMHAEQEGHGPHCQVAAVLAATPATPDGKLCSS